MLARLRRVDAARRQLVDEHVSTGRAAAAAAGTVSLHTAAGAGAGVHGRLRASTTGQRQRLRQREDVGLVDETAAVARRHRAPSLVARPARVVGGRRRRRQLRRGGGGGVVIVDSDLRRRRQPVAGLEVARPRSRCLEAHLIISTDTIDDDDDDIDLQRKHPTLLTVSRG